MHRSDNDIIVKQIADDTGTVVIKVHKVFPGIQLMYTEAHMERFSFGETVSVPSNVFEITHCKEGRMECKVEGEFCYLTPGDMAIAKTNTVSRESYFPLRHFHGISILIDVDQAPQCLSCLLDGVIVEPRTLIEKFCKQKTGFISRSNPSVEHIFSELYSVPEEIRKGYLKVKVLELLLFLSAFKIEENNLLERAYKRPQVNLAKVVARYLTENMERKVTLEELSARFHMSGTHIKNCFKGVYGVSYYAFVKTQKMESAAYMLEYTDKSILEIAGEHGYDNGSKFAGAFKSVMGMTPKEYRKIKHQNK